MLRCPWVHVYQQVVKGPRDGVDSPRLEIQILVNDGPILNNHIVVVVWSGV